jgi:hypothetical protein
MNDTPLQHYPSLDTFLRANRVAFLPRPKETWRLVLRPLVGEILGLPMFRGVSVATNGIIVALEDVRGIVRFGHLQYFVPDEVEAELLSGSDLFDEIKHVSSVAQLRHARLFEEFLL